MQFKTTPYAHQLEELNHSKDLENRAFFWEPGCGKSKPALDTGAHLFEQEKIDGILIVAPNGVDRNWHAKEIPDHLAPSHTSFLWKTKKAKQKGFIDSWKVFKTTKGLKIMCVSYDAIMTPPGEKAVRWFLDKHRTLFILDESHKIKTPGAKRTIRVRALGKYAKYRRILTGTPVTNCAFDVYSQLKFLSDDVWDCVGARSISAFRSVFGEFHLVQAGGRTFNHLVSYKNMDLLKSIVDKYGSRLCKEDVLDLPPKTYSQVYFEMNAKQKAAYRDLKEDGMAEIENFTVEVDLVVQLLTRLQQVTSNYLPDVDGNPRILDKTNPRILCLKNILEGIEEPMIIWAKYNMDIDLIEFLLNRMNIPYCVFDGRTSDEDRADAVDGFQEGRYKVFLGKPSAAGTGLTLHAAKTVVYYNNTYNLADRIQSEDRAHRVGQTASVHYIDIIAEDTIDEHIVKALQDKIEVSAAVTGDRIKQWLK